MGEEIKITYETIFEFLRNEKNKPELQKLDDTFFSDILNYLNEKAKINTNASDGFFSDNDRQKLDMQVLNIKRMLKDLYDKRESKIINMALNRSRSGSNLIDTSLLLKEEKELYDALCELFGRFRKDILINLVNSKTPELRKFTTSETKPVIQIPSSSRNLLNTEQTQNFTSADVYTNGSQSAPDLGIQQQNCVSDSSNSSLQATTSEQTVNKMVRFLYAVPKFVGKDLEVYGPFQEEDIANLPSEIADVLILKERVEEISGM